MVIQNFEIIQEKLTNWWNNGSQPKPLVAASLYKGTDKKLLNLEKYWTDIDGIMARLNYKLNNTEYYGVAVPYHHIDFSATAMACCLGGKIEYVNTETVWSHPVFNDLEDILNVKLTPENIAYKTQIDTTLQSASKATGKYFVSPWNLGGILDIISGLYSAQDLLLDLVLNPDKVKKVMDYVTKIWLDEFKNDISIIEKSNNTGYVCGWIGIWAPGSSFPIQEDFAYMISPEMFNEFSIPAIKQMVNAMDYPLFHLDGIGMIDHLDYLLDIDKLKAIQWQPGAGKEKLDQWYDLIKKIIDSGKSCQVFAKTEEVIPLADAVGSDRLLCIITDSDQTNIDLLKKQKLI